MEASPGIETSTTQRLQDLVAIGDRNPFIVEGYITAKRSFGSGLTFVDLVIAGNLDDTCQVLLKRDDFTGENYGGYRRCLLVGTRLTLRGTPSPTRNPGEAVLLVHSMSLKGLPRQPQHIGAILQLVEAGEIPIDEVARAAYVEEEELKKLLFRATGGSPNAEKHRFRSLAKSILASLPKSEEYDRVQEMRGSLTREFTLPPVPMAFRQPPLSTTMNDSTADKRLSVRETLQVNSDGQVFVVGWVQNRRRFEEAVTGLKLVDKLTPLASDAGDASIVDWDRLDCCLHPKLMTDEGECAMYGNLLAVGSQVLLEGQLVWHSQNNQGAPTLWVLHARLIRSCWRPTVVQYLIDCLCNNLLCREEAAEALHVSTDEIEAIAETQDVTERQWVANRLSLKLQSAQSRMANLSPELLSVLDKYQPLRDRWPILCESKPVVTGDVLQKGVAGSKWQRKKRPQLEWMGQEILGALRSHRDYGQRRLDVLDVGGGKGNLANFLAQYLGDTVRVHVVDIAPSTIANGAMRAHRLGVDVNYTVADASLMEDVDNVDVVVALHACGHLSDVALALAARHDHCAVVVCPCCFSSNSHLRIRKQRVEDYLGIPSTDWSALKLIAEVQGDTELANRAIHAICAVRANAIQNRTNSLQIKSFPIEFSTRNLCLVGSSG